MPDNGVQRNPETKRARYVTHDEFREVYAVAAASERLMMELTYRTLRAPRVTSSSGRRQTSSSRTACAKCTASRTRPAWSSRSSCPESVTTLLDKALGTDSNVARLKQPLVHRLDGDAYTYDGTCSNPRRSIEVANIRRKARGVAPMAPFSDSATSRAKGPRTCGCSA